MIVNILVLFLSATVGGIFYWLVPEQKGDGYKLSLIFAGTYLFSITIIHLIPEIYSSPIGGVNAGIYMLLGYFLQQILEYFTSGVEHGHIHHHEGHSHNHASLGIVSVVLALSVHAFLEGGLLAQPSTMHASHQGETLLAGIVLHKIPAAYALMAIATMQMKSRRKALLLLLAFALASPLGYILSDYSQTNDLVSDKTILILISLVCGSFLQISTTIAFESSPLHKFNLKSFLVAGAGAIVAIVAELI